MLRRIELTAIVLIALATLGATPSMAVTGGGAGQAFRVTVTNLTPGQVLSPPVVAVHDDSVRLFEPGAAASDELAQLAEDAVAGPLLGLLASSDGVLDVTVGNAPIPPGASASVEMSLRGRYRFLTVAGMLVTTNDAFYAATGRVTGPGSTSSMTGIAWDAGSEANTESCDDIPGPPCGNGLVRVVDGAEGHVHVHAGIHGGSSLNPGQHDWRNPTVLVRIERLH
jgi:hypothetical protein